MLYNPEPKITNEAERAKKRSANEMLVQHLLYTFVPGVDGIVLDAGCGTGIGSKILSRYCKGVYAVDITAESIRKAARENKAPNIIYEHKSVLDIPDTANFAMAVSIEVVEHIKDYEEYLKKLSIIAPKLIISTPNNKKQTKFISEYHYYEWDAEEFKEIMKEYYANVACFEFSMFSLCYCCK